MVFAHVVCKSFPRIKIVTSEIEIGLNEDFCVIPSMGEFGDRYFGTNDDEQVVVSSHSHSTTEAESTIILVFIVTRETSSEK